MDLNTRIVIASLRHRRRPVHAGFFLSFSVGLGAAVLLALACLAAEAATVEVPGEGEVTIYRDEWGVPHIYAATEEAGFYGLAYAQAEDQFPQLLSLLLAFQGRAASVYGDATTPSGFPAVEGDLRTLRWLHDEDAQRGYEERLSPQLKSNYQAYIAGLERYMAEHPEEVPAGTPDLEPWHVVAFSHAVLSDYFVNDGIADCRAAGVRLADALETSGPTDGGVRRASNEWVLAPWRSADNAMIVLSDPHGGVDGGIFYEFRMHAGDLHVAGYALGALMLLTHNENLSWGMTTGAPDVSDCYRVEVDPSNPQRYLFDGGWQEMTVRHVTVEVNDSAPVMRGFEYIPLNGTLCPVVGRDGDDAYAVCTAYMNAAGLFDEEVYRMNLARTVDEVAQANTLLGMFPQNVMVGDRFGDSYYLRAGRTPRRPAGHDWSRPVSGNTSATAWQGLHPVEDLVQIHNPAQGYMQNNNTPPELMVKGGDAVDPNDYPNDIYNDVEGLRYYSRGARVNEVLSRAYAFTTDDAVALALDEKWVGTEAWIDVLAEALERRMPKMAAFDAADPVRADRARKVEGVAVSRQRAYRRFVHRIVNFDGIAAAESVAALDYYFWRTALQDAGSPDQIRRLEAVVTGDAELSDDLADLIVSSLALAADTMFEELGTVDAAYGDVFRITANGTESWPLGGGPPIDVSPFTACRAMQQPAFSCALTLRAFMFSPADASQRRHVVAGSRVLRLVIFTDPLQSFTLHNFGQSLRPSSPHFDDQARLLTSPKKLKPTYFHPEELADHVVSSETLETR